jgi:hypothetical protein
VLENNVIVRVFSLRAAVDVEVGKLLLLVTLTALYCGCMTDESKRELRNLKQLASETPVYRDFKTLRSSTGGKESSAYLSIDYHSSADFEDVKGFYIQMMTSRGWGVPDEEQYRRIGGAVGRELKFHKGSYV